MHLHYVLIVVVVSDISDVKVMSSIVAVIFAITRVVNNYNIQTKPHFFEWNRTDSELNQRLKERTKTEPKFKNDSAHP